MTFGTGKLVQTECEKWHFSMTIFSFSTKISFRFLFPIMKLLANFYRDIWCGPRTKHFGIRTVQNTVWYCFVISKRTRCDLYTPCSRIRYKTFYRVEQICFQKPSYDLFVPKYERQIQRKCSSSSCLRIPVLNKGLRN